MKIRIENIEEGERFVWCGVTYVRGRECHSNMPGVFYRCKPIDGEERADRPFSAKLEVERVCESI